MSKRNGYHKTPKYRGETKTVTNRSKVNNILKTTQEKVVVLPEPTKSAADKNLYKTIRLENGLTALLISDPSIPATSNDSSSSDESLESSSESQESDNGKDNSGSSDNERPTKKQPNFDEEKLAACALCVGVGSYSDPPHIQGLAHFVEHMVFMGSQKYPKENEFDAFIKKRAGSDNASTDCEMTTFYFEIQEKYFLEAMDIFSQFFVSPLMRKEAMQREREAIESEFAIASPSESNRRDQLLASLFPEGHPARTFTWGNLKSLRDDLDADDMLYEAAHNFQKRHYSAHRMTLAVQARMDLETLERYVVSTFSAVPNNGLPPINFTKFDFHQQPITSDYNSIYYIKPISDVNEVHLTWCMRSLMKEYESKPQQYISYLLGHEGKGSLLSYLRKKVWALGIYTGNSESGIDYTSIYSLFSTQVVLTKEGLDHIDEVLEAIFSYINMLRHLGPNKRIFEEIQTIEDTSFRFEEESQPSDHVENLAESMQLFPPEHYITGDRLYYKYDPKGISELLEYMSPDRVNVMIVSNKHSKPINYDSKEKWFGTEYHKEEMPHSWLQRWSDVKPYDSFHIPEENIYLTNNFDLVAPAAPYLEEAKRIDINLEKSSAKEIHRKVKANTIEKKVLKEGDLIATINQFRLDQPNLLRKNNQMELWYKPDFKFRFPTALLYFYFITPFSLKSTKDSCLLDLWTDVLQQELKEQVYPASMADLSHSLYNGDMGLVLKVEGYSQNLHLLVDLITREMASHGSAGSNPVSPELFNAVKDVRARLYHNILLKPHKLAKDVRMETILEQYISARDKATTIYEITVDDLNSFSKLLFSKMYLQILIQGNLSWREAIKISDGVMANIEFGTMEKSEMPKVRVLSVPCGTGVVRVRSLHPSSTNSIVANYYQAGPASASLTAIIELLMMLMDEKVFDALRTKEQLGYSVYSMMRYTFGVLGFSVTVNTQVDKYSVGYVNQRIEAFLKKFGRDMKRMSEKTLQSTKHSLVQLKHTTDYELKEEVDRHWREIINREYHFHRLFWESEAIEAVKTSDIKKWVENHFASGNGTMFKKLSVQVIGNKPQDNTTSASPDEMKNYDLTFVGPDEDNGDSVDSPQIFIDNLKEFKSHLSVLEVPTVELCDC